jgi:hypothetical protein
MTSHFNDGPFGACSKSNGPRQVFDIVELGPFGPVGRVFRVKSLRLGEAAIVPERRPHVGCFLFSPTTKIKQTKQPKRHNPNNSSGFSAGRVALERPSFGLTRPTPVSDLSAASGSGLRAFQASRPIKRTVSVLSPGHLSNGHDFAHVFPLETAFSREMYGRSSGSRLFGLARTRRNPSFANGLAGLAHAPAPSRAPTPASTSRHATDGPRCLPAVAPLPTPQPGV